MRVRLPAARLTSRGTAFLVVAAVGLVAAYASGWAALLAVSLFLAGAVAVAAGAVLTSPPDVTAERRIDPPVAEARSEVTVTVTISGRTAAGTEWSERTSTVLETRGAVSGRLPHLGPGSPPARIEYSVTGRRRGEVEVGPLRVSRTDPLGLVAADRAVGAAGRLILLPNLHPVRPLAAATRLDPDPVSSAVFGLAGEQRDIVARTYRAGDPMRSVDWRSTAHRGELMVRSEAAASAVSTALVLETRSGAWQNDEDFEWAVECAASLTAELGAARAGVRLVTDRHGPIAGDASDVLVALATVRADDVAPRPAELVLRVRHEDVQVVHVITGPGSVDDLLRLPPLVHGAVGIVSVVAHGGAPAVVPPGWRAVVLDPRRPVSEAWS